MLLVTKGKGRINQLGYEKKTSERLENKKRKVKQNNTADLFSSAPGSDLKFRLTILSEESKR